jgi:hypothetical protein
MPILVSTHRGGGLPCPSRALLGATRIHPEPADNAPPSPLRIHFISENDASCVTGVWGTMVKVRAFRGYRPPPPLASTVASPPYDTLSSEEARRMADGNDMSFLRVSTPGRGYIHKGPSSRTPRGEGPGRGVSFDGSPHGALPPCVAQCVKPEIDLAPTISPYDMKVYERGAR